MKTSLFLALTLGFSCLASSCSKEFDQVETVPMVEYVLTAGIDTNYTKTYGYGKAVYWSKNDQLSLFQSSVETQGVVTRQGDKLGVETDTFKGTVPSGFSPEYAVYPYKKGVNSISGSTVTSAVYPNCSYVIESTNENSFANLCNLSMGKISSNKEVTMKNAMGLMKMTFIAPSTNTAETKRIRAEVYTHSITKELTPILGTISLNWDETEDIPVATVGSSSSNHFTAIPKLKTTGGTTNALIVPALPNVTYKGLRIIVKDICTGVEQAYFLEKDFTLSRNTVANLGTFSVPENAYTISQSFSGENLFECTESSGNPDWSSITSATFSYNQAVTGKSDHVWTLDGKAVYNTNTKILQLGGKASIGIPAVSGYRASSIILYTNNKMSLGKPYGIHTVANTTGSMFEPKSGTQLPTQLGWVDYPCVFPLNGSTANTSYFITLNSTSTVNAQIERIVVTYVPVAS